MNSEYDINLLIEKGHLQKAYELCLHLLKNADNIDDEIYYRNKLEEISDKLSNFNLLEGEAFFPVVIEATGEGVLKIIKVTSDECNFSKPIPEKIKNIVEVFLDGFIKKEIPHLLIMDFKLNDLKMTVKPLAGNDYEDIAGIDGNSYDAALFIAVLSYLFSIKVSKGFVFSAVLSVNEKKIIASKVKHTYKKEEAVIKGLGEQGRLYIHSSNIEAGNNIEKFNDADELVLKALPNLKNAINNAINIAMSSKNPKFDFLRLSNKISGNTESNKKVIIFTFNHSAIQHTKLKDVYLFFKDISGELIKENNGIIIDGLRVNYLVPMLLCQKEVTNHIKNFVAIRHTSLDKEGYEVAVVVRINSREEADYKVGDVIYYKFNSEH